MKNSVKRFLIIVLIMFLSISIIMPISAHGGRTDSSGGHNKTADGTYHYHSGRDRTVEYSSLPSDRNFEPEPAPTSISDKEEIKVVINDELIILEQPPIIKNSFTLVPMRSILEKLEATINWNGDTKTITSKLGETTIALTIDSNIATINEKNTVLDIAPEILNDRTFIPLRFVSESFNAKVDWDYATQTIFITTK